MGRTCWLMIGFSCLAVAMSVVIALSAASRCAMAAPPLSIEHLLDEKLPEAPKGEGEILADNSACFVCHGNYQEEEFVLVHAKGDVGCADCHGQSHDHRNDEDNITPPDKMYAEAGIEPGCAKCHKTHDAPATAVIARWQEYCVTKTEPEKLLCTDCHGKHRLKFRTVRWNKKTGELITGENGQERKEAAAPATDKEKNPKEVQ